MTNVAARTQQVAPGVVYCEPATDYSDGYRVTVGWSEEDAAWIAECSGMKSGEAIADGPTKEAALLSLACSLACLADALNN